MSGRFPIAVVPGEAFAGQTGWTPQWRQPEPKPSYDALVIVGGGHRDAALVNRDEATPAPRSSISTPCSSRSRGARCSRAAAPCGTTRWLGVARAADRLGVDILQHRKVTACAPCSARYSASPSQPRSVEAAGIAGSRLIPAAILPAAIARLG